MSIRSIFQSNKANKGNPVSEENHATPVQLASQKHPSGQGVEQQSPKGKHIAVAWRNNQGNVECPGNRCTMQCGDHCPIWLNSMASQMLNEGRNNKALFYYEQSFALDPDIPETSYNMALVYTTLEKHRKAYESFKHAVALNPGNARALRGLIVSEKKLDLFSEALEHCDLFARFPGNDADTLRADLLTRSNRIDDLDHADSIQLELLQKLLKKSREAGYIQTEKLLYISSLMVQANKACTVIIQDTLPRYNAVTAEGDVASLKLSAYAGIGAVYCWNTNKGAIERDGIVETLAKNENVSGIGQYVLDSIGLPFDSSERKSFVQFISKLADEAHVARILCYGGRDALAHACIAMFDVGMTIGMNRLGITASISSDTQATASVAPSSSIGSENINNTATTSVNPVTEEAFTKPVISSQGSEEVMPNLPAPRYCRKCGFQLLKGSSSCSRCGTKVVQVQQDSGISDKSIYNTVTVQPQAETVIVRDQQFWEHLQKLCIAAQEQFKEKTLPLLNDAGLLSASGNTVRIDINNMKRPLLVMAELWVFPIAVLVAALNDYLPSITEEDEKNIKKYLYSCGDSVLQTLERMAKDETRILYGRINDYNTACKEEMVCGFSSYGQGKLLFHDFEEFNLCAGNKNHEAKCSFLFGDFLYYFNYYGSLPTLSDIRKLKTVVAKNSSKYAVKFENLYMSVHPFVGALYSEVKSITGV